MNTMSIQKFQITNGYIAAPSNAAKNNGFIAGFGLLTGLSEKCDFKKIYRVGGYLKIENLEGGFKAVKSDSFQVGAIFESAVAYSKSSKREYLYVLSSDAIEISFAVFQGTAAIKRFVKKAKKSLTEALESSAELSRGLTPKEKLIVATFSRLGTTPAEYSHKHGESESSEDAGWHCELCDTKINNRFLIRHDRDNTKDLWIGSECVVKQCRQSGDAGAIINSEVLRSLISSVKSKKDINTKILEVAAPEKTTKTNSGKKPMPGFLNPASLCGWLTAARRQVAPRGVRTYEEWEHGLSTPKMIKEVEKMLADGLLASLKIEKNGEMLKITIEPQPDIIAA